MICASMAPSVWTGRGLAGGALSSNMLSSLAFRGRSPDLGLRWRDERENNHSAGSLCRRPTMPRRRTPYPKHTVTAMRVSVRGACTIDPYDDTVDSLFRTRFLFKLGQATIVAIKQVPGTANVRIDPETGTLIREDVPAGAGGYAVSGTSFECMRSNAVSENKSAPLSTETPPRCTPDSASWPRPSALLPGDSRTAGPWGRPKHQAACSRRRARSDDTNRPRIARCGSSTAWHGWFALGLPESPTPVPIG